MKSWQILLIVSCLTLLIACQSPQPTEPPLASSIVTPVPSSSPTTTSTPASTITPTPFAQVLRLESPFTAATAAAPTWTYWSAQLQGWFTVAANDETLWAGTPKGAYRIDPRTGSYTAYPEVGPIEMLLPVEDGRLWAKGNKGVFFFDGQHWSKLGLFAIGNTLGIDLAGDLWLVDLNGRYGPKAVRFTGHTPPDDATWPYDYYPPYDMPPQFSARLTDCQTWAAIVSQPYGSISRLYSHRTPQECQTLQATYPLAPHSDFPPALVAIDRDGSIWSVTDRTLVQRSGNTTTAQKLPTDQVMAIAPDPVHSVWLGTDRGVWYSDGQTLRAMPLDSDPQRGVWVGTNWGLTYTDGKTWYGPEDLDPYSIAGYPSDLALEPSGQAWLLTTESKLGWLQSAPSSKFKFIAGIGAHALAASANGVWITHGTDLIRLKLGDPIPASLFPPIPDCKLDHLTTNRIGDVWATTRCGFVWQYQPATGQWIRHVLNAAAPHDTNSDAIQRIVAGADGTLYASGLSGLGQLTEPDSAITGTLEPNEEQLPYVTYRHRALLLPDGTALQPHGPVAVDRQGGVWLATNRGELWHCTSGHATRLETPFGSTAITALQMDQHDQMWATSNDRQLAVYAGRDWRVISMPDIGQVNRIVEAPDGRMWFVGNAGIAVYDPTLDK